MSLVAEPTMYDRVRELVLVHPLHRGAEFAVLSAADGRATTAYAVNDMTANVVGKLHGGVIYMLHDVSAFVALSTVLSFHHHAVTAETHCSVLRPADHGETIIVRAHVDRRGRSLAFMRCESFARRGNGEERLIATGSVTKAISSATPGRDR